MNTSTSGGRILDSSGILSLLRLKCAEEGSQKSWADKNGVSPAYVSDILQERREISDRIAESLGYRKIVVFAKTEVSEKQDKNAIERAEALLDLDARGSLSPHGIGGLARNVIIDLIERLKSVASIRYADGNPEIQGPLVEDEAAQVLLDLQQSILQSYSLADLFALRRTVSAMMPEDMVTKMIKSS